MDRKKCADVVKAHAKGRTQDIREMMEFERTEQDDGKKNAGHPEHGPLNEYGLCFDYVAPGTFKDQKRGYFRFQISYGGPSEEYRFFTDEGLNCVRIEFWYLDWFDGAKEMLRGRDKETMLEWWNDVKDMGSVEAEYKKATE